MEFMYKCEYFKPNCDSNYENEEGRESSCRVCKISLNNTSSAQLIMRRVPSLTKPNDWLSLGPFLYHMECFVEEFRPTNADCIKNFESIDIIDQMIIQESISGMLQGKPSTSIERFTDGTDKVSQEIIATPSKLPLKIQELVNTLFETTLIPTDLAEIQLITRERNQSEQKIELALTTLTHICNEIRLGVTTDRCIDLSKDFYKLIPCNVECLIDTEAKVIQKRKLVESMKNIETVYLKVRHEIKAELDPVDRLYERLGTDIAIVDSEEPIYSIIKQYLENTTGILGSCKLTIDELFKVDRHGEVKRNASFQNLHNRQLLWHGSQQTNFVGILQNGLKIAPPEAKFITGHRFGKGIYFSDIADKSAFYSLRRQNTGFLGFMVLCEVALGEIQVIDPNVSSFRKIHLCNGKSSIKSEGSVSVTQTHVLDSGVGVPLGPLVDIETDARSFTEYIVFNPAQVTVQYLVKVKELQA